MAGYTRRKARDGGTPPLEETGAPAWGGNSMKNATITVRPLSAHTGAEIGGVDLSQPMSEQTYLEIR